MDSRPHLLHVFSNFVPSGPELRTVAVLGAFGRRYRHSIVSMDGRTSAAERLAPDLDVRLLANPPKRGLVATAYELRRILVREKPDLLLTYGWGAFDMLVAARTCRLGRVVHHEEGFNADEATTFKRRRIYARRVVLPGVHTVVVPSTRLEKIALDVWRLPRARVRLIPNGIDVTRFGGADENPAARAALRLPPDAFVVGAVGHLRAEKNFIRLLEACSRIEASRNLHIVIAGEGDERAAILRRAADLSLEPRLHLLGYRSDLPFLLRAFDVFAISSDTEQMPVSLLEAMASHLPVVATDVGDIRQMLPPEQLPFVVRADEHGELLAHALDRVIRDPGGRRRLGDANRRRVEETYTFDRMLALYDEVYTGALSADGRAPRAPAA